MDMSTAWFALGVLAAVLMAILLGQEIVAAGFYVGHSIPLNAAALLNPFFSPNLAIAAGLVFTVWTLVKARRAP